MPGSLTIFLFSTKSKFSDKTKCFSVYWAALLCFCFFSSLDLEKGFQASLGPDYRCLSLDITRLDACLSLVLRKSESRLSLETPNDCLSLVTSGRSSAASHWTLPGQMLVSHWFSGRAKVVSHWTLRCLSLIGHLGPV
jgi:hypothetical protein